MLSKYHRNRLGGLPAEYSAKAGFTLLEVMVALAVVAIALMAVYRMHSQTLFMDARGRFDTVAAMLARQKIADINTQDLTEMVDDSGEFDKPYAGYAWQTQSETVDSELYSDDGPILKRISITISRNADGSQFGLVTYRHLYE